MRPLCLPIAGLSALLLAACGAWAEPPAAAEPFLAEPPLSVSIEEASADAMLFGDPVAMAAGEPSAIEEAPGAPPVVPSPLPMQTYEGYGGTTFVPLAYLLNPGPAGELFGMPSASYSFTKAGDKDLHIWALSITLLRRVEVSWAINRVGLGDWPDKVRVLTAGFRSAGRDHLYMHNINLRGLLIEEADAMPAVTGGAHFKIGQGVHSIDHRMGGGARRVGFEKESGVDFTLTASKTCPNLVFGRPLIATAGLRWSKGSQIGWTGFGSGYRTSWEGSLICMVTDQLATGYEYRMKRSAYTHNRGLYASEDDWHSIFAAYAIDEHMKVRGQWMYAGELGRGIQACVWGIQFQYDF